MALISSIREKSGVILSVLLLVVVIGVVAVSPPSGEITFFRFGAGSDNSAPSVSVSAPTSNLVEGQNAVITARAFDNKEVDRIYIIVDNRLVKTCTARAPTGSCVYNSNALSAGIHTYFVLAFDSSGNRLRDPASGTNSFTINAKTASTSTSGLGVSDGKSGSGKGAGGAQTTGGTTITVSPEPGVDPYGQTRYYIDTYKGDKLKLNVKCDVDSGAPHIKVSVRDPGGAYGIGEYYVEIQGSAKSPFDFEWDGIYRGQPHSYYIHGEPVPRNFIREYKLRAECDKDGDNRADAIYEKDIFIDGRQPHTDFNYLTGKHDQKELIYEYKPEDPNAELLEVRKISFAGRPGGILCGAKIKMQAYDKDGKQVAHSNSWWGGKEGYVDAHQLAGGSTTTIGGDLTVKKIYGKVEKSGSGWGTNYCDLIDDFYVVVHHDVPTDSGGGTPTLKISVDTDKTEISVNAGATLTASTYPLAADLTKIYVDGKTVTECSNVGLPDYSKITVCSFIFYATSSDVGVHSYYATAKDSAGNVVSSDTKSFTVVSGGGTTTYDISITKSGTGSGKVTSSDGKINCGSDCSEKYELGTKVTLTATADSGSTFPAWGIAACYGSTAPCTFTVDSAKSVTARFDTVQPVQDKTPPTVATVLPTTAVKGSSTAFNAATSDNAKVNSCDFYFNNAKIGAARLTSGTSSSGRWTFDYAPANAGTFPAYFSCTDSSGYQGKGSVVNVNVVETGCAGNHGSCDSITPDKCASHSGCRVVRRGGLDFCQGLPHACSSFTTESVCRAEAQFGCKWTGASGGVTDKTAPTVSAYTTPASPKVGETIVYAASASDDVLLKEIQVYVDGKPVQKCAPENTKTGAICAFRTSYSSPGTHTFMAKAEDTSGNVRWDPSSSTTKSVSVTAVAGAGEGVEVALPFPINAWGYYNRYGDCSSQEVNRAWADAFCKAKGYAGTISGDACYQEPVGGRYSVAGTPQSPKEGDYKGAGTAFTKVRCTYATQVPTGTGVN